MTSAAPQGWPDGYGRIVLEETDSTLGEAERRFDDLPGPTWILALRQTRARGRQGRVWHQPQGNFAGTLVQPVEAGPEAAALRSFTAALALHDAFVAVTGRSDPFALKWPNDVLVNGGKVAGILLESVLRGGRMAGVKIGIGINLAAAPDPGDLPEDAVRPVSLSGETGVTVTPEEFLTHLATAYARYEGQLGQFGFAPIREAWLARAAKLGETIRARTARVEHHGIFETIDAHGHLVLQTAEGRETVAAADVFF